MAAGEKTAFVCWEASLFPAEGVTGNCSVDDAESRDEGEDGSETSRREGDGEWGASWAGLGWLGFWLRPETRTERRTLCVWPGGLALGPVERGTWSVRCRRATAFQKGERGKGYCTIPGGSAACAKVHRSAVFFFFFFFSPSPPASVLTRQGDG